MGAIKNVREEYVNKNHQLRLWFFGYSLDRWCRHCHGGEDWDRRVRKAAAYALEQYAYPDRVPILLAVLQLFCAQRTCGAVQTPPAFPRLRCSSTRRCTNE